MIYTTRSQAAQAARKELGEGKFFRTTQTADGDWKWHYEPGAHVGLGLTVKRDYIAWVEVTWDRTSATPFPVPVAIVTCRLAEIEDAPAGFLIEPITPELFQAHNPFAKAAKPAPSTGERPRSTVENPTKLVWRLADEMVGQPRAAVIAACEAAGVNKATASTQFYRWQKARSV